MKVTCGWILSVFVVSVNVNEIEIWNATFLISWICWVRVFLPPLFETKEIYIR